MQTVQNLKDLILNQGEYCYLYEKQKYYARNFKLRVPKFMPNVPQKGSRKNFNKNIFINDAACKPNVSSSISTQGFVTVPRSPNCSLQHKADKYGWVYPGLQLTCNCMNNNIRDLNIIDSV